MAGDLGDLLEAYPRRRCSRRPARNWRRRSASHPGRSRRRCCYQPGRHDRPASPASRSTLLSAAVTAEHEGVAAIAREYRRCVAEIAEALHLGDRRSAGRLDDLDAADARSTTMPRSPVPRTRWTAPARPPGAAGQSPKNRTHSRENADSGRHGAAPISDVHHPCRFVAAQLKPPRRHRRAPAPRRARFGQHLVVLARQRLWGKRRAEARPAS